MKGVDHPVRTVGTVALALLAAPLHLLLALAAPGTRPAAPTHILLRLWDEPPGIAAQLLIVLIELAMFIAALGAIAVGILSLPALTAVAVARRMSSRLRAANGEDAEEGI